MNEKDRKILEKHEKKKIKKIDKKILSLLTLIFREAGVWDRVIFQEFENVIGFIKVVGQYNWDLNRRVEVRFPKKIRKSLLEFEKMEYVSKKIEKSDFRKETVFVNGRVIERLGDLYEEIKKLSYKQKKQVREYLYFWHLANANARIIMSYYD